MVTDIVETVEAELAFMPASRVAPDPERPGLLRARTMTPEEQQSLDCFEVRGCRVRDWGASDTLRMELLRDGFECVDLSPLAGVRPVLERVRDAGHCRGEDAQEIRRRLGGTSLHLADGSRIRLLMIAPEGFIMRKAGPNRLRVGGERSTMNDHDAATSVHADQDVLGTPLRQMMRGAAPWLFRHDAPDSRNGWSPLMLLNLWLPLQQITRPLALMDQRTLDRRAHQLRYGLPTESFLERDEERSVNDIWTFLYDDDQQWYFHADLPLGRAYLFETMATPHGSFVIPGEDQAERRYRQLEAASQAIAKADEPGLRRALEPGEPCRSEIATLPLRRAVEAMDALIAEAGQGAAALCRGEGSEQWCARARTAMDAVVRKSIEMRVVAVRVPGLRRRGEVAG